MVCPSQCVSFRRVSAALILLLILAFCYQKLQSLNVIIVVGIVIIIINLHPILKTILMFEMKQR